MATRISSSLWGRWFDENDERAKGELPPEVVALLAIADLRDFVLEIASVVDDLHSATS